MTVGTMMTWHSGLQLSMAIFFYFIERPGVYTQQELLQWKSLEAYNYFKSGHVVTVELWVPSNSLGLLRAFVNPSKKSPDKQHRAWVAVQVDGHILTICLLLV